MAINKGQSPLFLNNSALFAIKVKFVGALRKILVLQTLYTTSLYHVGHGVILRPLITEGLKCSDLIHYRGHLLWL